MISCTRPPGEIDGEQLAIRELLMAKEDRGNDWLAEETSS